MFDQDIQSVAPANMRLSLALERLDLTLLTACPPCQGFSTLGTGKDDDHHNDLVGCVWPFVREFLPEAVLLENVRGLARDKRWTLLRRQLRSIGYRVASWVVDAADFGVPQHRRRLVAVAVRDRASQLPLDPFEFLPPTFDLTAPHAGDAIAEAGSIQGTNDSLHRARTLSPTTLQRVREIPPGGGHADLPEELQLACHKRLRRDGKRGATSPYGRIRHKGPAPTMTTRCTTVSCGRFVHPTEDRGISLREAALLQTFPSAYDFKGSHQSVERQIGNAVPVRLAQALGLVVRQATSNSRMGVRAR